MDHIFFDLPCVFIYLDDLLIASRTAEDHRRHVREVLTRLHDSGLRLNSKKCVWGQQAVDFLGHRVSAAGISPLPDRVTALRSFPELATIEQLQAFLGLFNYYRRFVPAAAKILRPLTDALKGGGSGKAAVQWTEAMKSAFAAARVALADTAQLAHPAVNAELSLVTDASSSHVRAVLQQRRRGRGWEPLGFFSRKLTTAESQYSTFDRELLAVYAALLHFQFLLEGQKFVIFTDHRPLVGAIGRLSDPKSDRQRRHLFFIAADIRHIAGETNIVAGTLSRPACSTLKVRTGRTLTGSAGSRPAGNGRRVVLPW
jgi:RNase H-like domain found in reverse transcriptase/Reverse transcriptase (RNA-dependent DNA polymerase)